jgi:hypothetical protein
MGVEGCSSTDERDPDTEDIQRCQLVTKHPCRNCNRRELLEDTSNTHWRHSCALNDTAKVSRSVGEPNR